MRTGGYLQALRCLLLFVALNFSCSAATYAADTRPLVLENLTTADGLPQGTVMTTLQDSRGFIWLGTEDGLVRYDGRLLVRYAYSRNNSNGLPGNFIYQIVEDPHHDLWVAVKDAGIARWNRATDTFTVYRHDAANTNSLSSDSVRSIAIDAKGLIWIGTQDTGINILDPVTERFRQVRHNEDPNSLIDDHITTLQFDRSGSLWVGTERGLDSANQAARTFAHYRHDPTDPLSLSADQVSKVFEDRAGDIWVGTFDGGLNHLNRFGRLDRT